jgi:hypothetical protein
MAHLNVGQSGEHATFQQETREVLEEIDGLREVHLRQRQRPALRAEGGRNVTADAVQLRVIPN